MAENGNAAVGGIVPQDAGSRAKPSTGFNPITTQAEFDAAIANRLERQEKSIAARYEGAMPKADVDALKAGYEKAVADLKAEIEKANGDKAASEERLTEALAKIKGYETDSVKTRIALEVGLPYAMAGRLAGETAEDIRKDAEALKNQIDASRPVAPLGTTEGAGGGANTRDQFANWFGEKLGR